MSSIYYIGDFFVLRTPLFPYAKSFQFNPKDSIVDEVFMEALSLASPDLSDRCAEFSFGQAPKKDIDKLTASLYRYWSRAAYRCTPFGLFAGLSMGTFSNMTNIKLGTQGSYKKNTRLDTHFLSAFMINVVSNTEVRNKVLWYPNNTIYRVFDRIRYIKYYIEKNSRSHQISSIPFTEYVETVIQSASEGRTIDELAMALVGEEISIEEAIGFISEMISECLLISSLEPKVTGQEYHNYLISELNSLSPVSDTHLSQLKNVCSILDKIDEHGIGASKELYNQVKGTVTSWGVDFDPGKLLQCDLFKPATNCLLNQSIQYELNKTISLLNAIIPMPEGTNMIKFKEEFLKKYEAKDIPLVEALDPDIGIGYPPGGQMNSDNAPLVGDIQVRYDSPAELPKWDEKWTKYILRKIEECLLSKSKTIEITESERAALFGETETMENTLPDSAYTLCNILSPSGGELDRGNFIINHVITSGPSSASLLGRFCHLDPALTELTKKSLAQEEQLYPDAVFAEILHIPQARLGNILMRPTLREFEIPILTMSSTSNEKELRLDDLMVSIRNDQVVLRSRRLGKQVFPRLTTAHNFAMNPIPHYYFLCDLQFQNIKSTLTWDWGILNYFSFLPRVTYRKTILSKARWYVSIEDILGKGNSDAMELESKMDQYLTDIGLPKSVTLSEGDNQLLIDRENEICKKILMGELLKGKTIHLQENIFNHHNLFVQNDQGSFTNETIIPWSKKSPVKKTDFPTTSKTDFPSKIPFAPGSSWLYVKIFCGVKTADTILVDLINPTVKKLLENSTIDKFFFIRFADPDHHLRLRFHGDGDFIGNVSKSIKTSLEPFLESRLVWKIQIDTYFPELERYGNANIENSETLFFFDSVASMEIISMLEGDEGDNLRWVFAIKGVNDMLDSFKFTLEEKTEIMRRASEGFRKEFRADNIEVKKQLTEKFRGLRKQLEIGFSKDNSELEEFRPVWEIFAKRKVKIDECVQKIEELELDNKLEVGKTDLALSYVHMFLNRFLRSKQRFQEMVLYDLLFQHFNSHLARKKKKNLNSI